MYVPMLATILSFSGQPLTAHAPVADEPAGWVVTQTFTHKHPVTALAFGPDLVASGDKEGVLVVWDAKTGKEKKTILDGNRGGMPLDRADPKPIDRVQFSLDGEWLRVVTTGGDMMHECSVAKGRVYPSLTGGGDMRVDGTNPGGNYWLMTVPQRKTLILVTNTFKDGTFSREPDGRFDHKDVIDFSAAGEDDVIITIAGGVLRRVVRGKDKPTWETPLDKFAPTALVVGAGNKVIAVAGKNGEVRLYSTDAGKLVRTLAGHEGAVAAVAFSPNGKRIATAGADKTARVWDVETGKELAVLKGHTNVVTCVAFSPGGEMIATSSVDKTAKVWEFRK